MITRGDIVGQAISLESALQDGAWYSAQPKTRKARYDYRRIQKHWRLLAEMNRGWASYLSRIGVEPLHVTYEQLSTDYERTAELALRHIGVYRANMKIAPQVIDKQADSVSAEWYERFLADSAPGPLRKAISRFSRWTDRTF